MLIYHRTSLLQSQAQTVVNTVNCVGVMGKGIAAEFKQRYPEMFDAYRVICERGELEPGKLWLWKGEGQWVLNFPTKRHWRNPSKVEWIEAGLQKFVQEYERRGISEISFPRLGCGNGNLDWDVVRPIMEAYLSRLPIAVYVHDFEHDVGIPEHLEAALATSRCSTTLDGSFDKFRTQIECLLTDVGDKLVDLETGKPFSASVSADGLVIHGEFRASLVTAEDLRGAWQSLLGGVLTKEKLAWASGEEASHLLSVVGLLPNMQPVEIQKVNSLQPELAVQLRRDPGAMGAGTAGQQFEFALG